MEWIGRFWYAINFTLKNNMINVFFILNKNPVIQTYSTELLSFFKEQKNIYVHQIYLKADDVSEFTITKKNNLDIIKIPEINSAENNPKYFDRASLLLFNYYTELENVLLHCNIADDFHFAVSMKKRFNCPVVFIFQLTGDFLTYIDYNSLYDQNDNLNGIDISGMMLNFADQIICVSKFTHRVALKYYSIDSKRIKKINYSISNRPLIADSDIKIKLKTQYGFCTTDRILLCNNGCQSVNNGLYKLIKAFMLLKNDYREIKLVIAGTVDFNKYMTSVQECIGRICFIGELEKQELETFCQLAEIAIITTLNGQGYYMAIEMMHFCLPFIVPDNPWMNELIEHEKTGLFYMIKQSGIGSNLFEPDEKDIALKLRILLDNPEYSKQLAKTSQKECKKRFSSRKMCENTFIIYEQLIQNHNNKEIEKKQKMKSCL